MPLSIFVLVCLVIFQAVVIVLGIAGFASANVVNTTLAGTSIFAVGCLTGIVINFKRSVCTIGRYRDRGLELRQNSDDAPNKLKA